MFRFVWLLFLVGLSTVECGISTAPAPKANLSRNKACSTLISELTKLHLGQLSKCYAKLGYVVAKDKKSSCVMKCVMQSIGVLKEDGTVSVNKLEAYIDDHFPEDLRDEARKSYAVCVNLIDTKQVKKSTRDLYCKTHEEFLKCIGQIILKICH